MLYDFLAPKEVGARQHEMDCLALMFDRRGLVNEAYSGRVRLRIRILPNYKLALYQHALQKRSNTDYYEEEENIFRLQGPDGGFQTGYDQIRT
jgi:hypothetical protein